MRAAAAEIKKGKTGGGCRGGAGVVGAVGAGARGCPGRRCRRGRRRSAVGAPRRAGGRRRQQPVGRTAGGGGGEWPGVAGSGERAAPPAANPPAAAAPPARSPQSRGNALAPAAGRRSKRAAAALPADVAAALDEPAGLAPSARPAGLASPAALTDPEQAAFVARRSEFWRANRGPLSRGGGSDEHLISVLVACVIRNGFTAEVFCGHRLCARSL